MAVFFLAMGCTLCIWGERADGTWAALGLYALAGVCFGLALEIHEDSRKGGWRK